MKSTKKPIVTPAIGAVATCLAVFNSNTYRQKMEAARQWTNCASGKVNWPSNKKLEGLKKNILTNCNKENQEPITT